MSAICLQLPWPPGVNNLFSTVKSPKGLRRIPTRRYKDWIDAASDWVVSQGSPCLKGRFCISIECSPPDLRRRDLDGLAKAPLDLLVHCGVVEDDHMADRIMLCWSEKPAAKPGHVSIVLRSAAQIQKVAA